MEEKIKRLISQAISDKVFPACVFGLVSKSGKRIIIPQGRFTYKEDSRMVQEDSIFDVASLTKSIPTASLALALIDQNKLSLEDQLITFIPEFNGLGREQILIKHLLTQTLNFNIRLSEHKNQIASKILEAVFTANLNNSPGMELSYANISSILLGLVIERVSHKLLNQLAHDYFFQPLKMTRTTFRPLEKFNQDEIVPTEIQDWRGGLVQGEIHDESAFVLNKKMIVGSAGLFSTAPDILNFLEILLHDGQFQGKNYFSPAIIKQMKTNQLSDNSEFVGLGWELNQKQYMGQYCYEDTFGKTGFTGCVCVCDLSRGLAFVILSNYVYPYRKKSSRLINNLRRDVADLVFMNINDY